jgi:hypothetical protein
MLRWQIAAALLVIVSVMVACTDIYRDPCGYVRPDAVTESTMRTKNKALGWAPPSSVVYEIQAPSSAARTMGPKCD